MKPLKNYFEQESNFFFKLFLIISIFIYLFNNFNIELKNFYFLDVKTYFLCLIFILGSIFAHSFRWFLILKKKIYIKFTSVVRVIFESLFVSTFTPSVIGFDAYRIYFLKKNKISYKFSFFSIIIDRLSGIFVMFIFLIFFLKEIIFYFIGYKFILILLISFSLFFFLIFIFFKRHLLNYIKLFVNIYDIKDGLNIIFVSLINFLCLLISLFLVLDYCFDSSGKYQIFIISILFIFLSSIPITPQNIGVTEFVILFLAEKHIILSLNPDLIFISLVHFRIIQTFMFFLGSLFFFNQIRLKNRIFYVR